MYRTLDELQTNVDELMHYYNKERPYSGKYCYGKTPMQTFAESKYLANEKQPGNQKWQAFDAEHWIPTTVADNLSVR